MSLIKIIGTELEMGGPGSYTRSGTETIISGVASEELKPGDAVKFNATTGLIEKGVDASFGIVVKTIATNSQENELVYAEGDNVPVLIDGAVVVPTDGSVEKYGTITYQAATGKFKASGGTAVTGSYIVLNGKEDSAEVLFY